MWIVKMTPAAPTAAWRKVCEEYFSRLIEDLEQQVESEVESRVTAAIEAAVRGAVVDAIGESRRALAGELNQGVRRLRQAADADDLYSTLLDVTVPFCEQAAVFSVHEKRARAERMRRPAEVHAGEDGTASSLPALEFPVSEAAAFATALDTRDPVIAMSTPAEVSPALVRLLNHKPDERAYLFPLAAGETVAGILYASLNVHAQPLELFSEVAGLQLRALAAGSVHAAAPEVFLHAAVSEADEKPQDPLVTISGSFWKQPKVAAAPVPDAGAQGRRDEWWDLSPKEQQMHLAAQRFARVQVAEMRLARPDAVRSGRVARDLYGAFKESVDAARAGFREKHMTLSPTMVDYLHLELVRSLADDDANLLGPSYPGPLA
jgi:hypothetical protein